ncbi:methyltransferase [Bacteroidales bacterium]|nr:methyltransferase [Bacteroidales bacterium]
MRIVGGIHRSRRFSPPKNFKARPTTDFAKENIFNVLNNLIELEDAEGLDLFAGTGSLGFEMISRGCSKVIAIEKEPINYNFINTVKEKLKAEGMLVLKADAFKYIDSCPHKFDLIFADPPFELKELDAIPALILSKELLKPGGIFVMEHPANYDFSHLPLFDHKREYGAVNFSVFIAQES